MSLSASTRRRALLGCAAVLVVSSAIVVATDVLSARSGAAAQPTTAAGHNPYGTDGSGNPSTADCTTIVAPGQSIDAAITTAPARGVVCVQAGDYHSQTVHLNRPGLTVRATGRSRIQNAIVTGDRATLDGFTVVGTGTYGVPEAGIRFAGHYQHIVRNLVDGRELTYGIQCETSAPGQCNAAEVDHNTVGGIQNFGLWIAQGTRSTVEWNNVYDLHTDSDAKDVDGMRFFGGHVIRNNYIHDINQFKSVVGSTGDTPHTDCFQTYDDGPGWGGTLIEDNICVRVGRQCLIAQNDVAPNYLIHDITFRDNICETYDAQGINLGSMKHTVVQNNLVLSGFFEQRQVISEEQQHDGPTIGPANTGLVLTNNILVRAKASSFSYERIGVTTDEHFRNNLELLDTSIAHRDPDFQNSRNAYPAYRASDFTDYRSYAQRLLVMDRGVPGNTATHDLDGRPRVVGRAIDLGPWEFGTCGQRC